MVEIDNPDAMKKYYELLLSVVRVITSVVLSRGPQNGQTIDQARMFLAENRAGIIAIFKRQAKISGVLAGDAGADLDELVEFYVLLMTMTNFLDVSLLCLLAMIRSLTRSSSRNSETRRGQQRAIHERIQKGPALLDKAL